MPRVRSSQMSLFERRLLVVVDRLRHPLDELARLRIEADGDVLGEPAGLEVTRVHARPAHHLDEVEDQVALAEAVPEHRDRTQLERGRAEEDEVRVDAVQLAQQHPHPGRLLRDLELQQLLDREHEHELVVLEPDVVDALGVRDPLPPRLLLHRLLEPGVQIADHRGEADDLLAAQVDDQAKHAVRRRVVRPEVDLQDVAAFAEPLVHVQHRRDRMRDPRAFVDPRPWRDSHRYSSPEKRTGSPPIG